MVLFGDSAGLRLGLVPPTEETSSDDFEQFVCTVATAVPQPRPPMDGANVSWLAGNSWRTEADAMLGLDRMCADLGVESARMAVFAPPEPHGAEDSGGDVRMWMERWAEEREALWIDTGRISSNPTPPSPSALAQLTRAVLPKNIDLTDSGDSDMLDGPEVDDPWSALATNCIDSMGREGIPPAEWVPLPPARRYRTTSSGSSRDGVGDHDGFLPLGFGNHTVLAEQIFYQTPLSFAFVNIRPVVRGHVLVATRRAVPRFASLRPDEIADLWTTVQQVGEVVRKENGAKSLTMAIQDGEEAGQTVPHVHVHVLPRRPNDFKQNDEVYSRIDESERGQTRPPSEVCSPKSPFRSSRLLKRPMGTQSPDAPVEETGIPITSSRIGGSPVAPASSSSNGDPEGVSVFRTGSKKGDKSVSDTSSSELQAQFARARRTAGRATQMVASASAVSASESSEASPLRGSGGFARKVLGDAEASKWRPARLAQTSDMSQPFGSVRGSPLTAQGQLRTATPVWRSPGKASPAHRGGGLDASESEGPRTPEHMAREASIYRSLLVPSD